MLTLGNIEKDIRLYGRRRARKLRKDQQRSMDIYDAEAMLANISGLFRQESPFERIELEIGFGAGEHLLAQAAIAPKVAFIGAEPFENGFSHASVWAANQPNLFLYNGDGRVLFRHIPPSSLDRAYILFPDPWPKRRHEKRRLINQAFLESLVFFLKPAGEVRFASDFLNYAVQVIQLLESSGNWSWNDTEPRESQDEIFQNMQNTRLMNLSLQQIPEAYQRFLLRLVSWPQTRYETKARLKGSLCCYLSVLKV
ncbi:MAG: tRNA (guanine(46)-N(7))-methyltransferase TrmB [Holosporales bacterium]|jgi:tRNA (guanine-N7-)-methyltransferase|nr:tRNA (guanine(46)-N(7))-methyltransferase TrmB [Holosporales bacterium]